MNNTLDAPWVGEGVPLLYFENARQNTPTVELAESDIEYNGMTLVAEDAQSIALYNMQGLLVAIANGPVLDVANVANGIYVAVSIDAQGEHKSRKIVIR